MNKRLQFYIKGNVQGVWFRKSCKEEADKLSLSGFVRNEANGDVYCEAEGDIEDLMQFAEWCKTGPQMARVDSVKMIEGVLANTTGFEITR